MGEQKGHLFILLRSRAWEARPGFLSDFGVFKQTWKKTLQEVGMKSLLGMALTPTPTAMPVEDKPLRIPSLPETRRPEEAQN